MNIFFVIIKYDVFNLALINETNGNNLYPSPDKQEHWVRALFEKAVAGLIEDGFNRVIFGLPSADADSVLPMVERYAAIAHKFNA